MPLTCLIPSALIYFTTLHVSCSEVLDFLRVGVVNHGDLDESSYDSSQHDE